MISLSGAGTLEDPLMVGANSHVPSEEELEFLVNTALERATKTQHLVIISYQRTAKINRKVCVQSFRKDASVRGKNIKWANVLNALESAPIYEEQLAPHMGFYMRCFFCLYIVKI
jgi:hypothetical protein